MIEVTHDEHGVHTITGLTAEDAGLLKQALNHFRNNTETTLDFYEDKTELITSGYRKILLDNIYNAKKILNALNHPLVKIRPEVSE